MNETKQRPVLVFDAAAFDAAVKDLGYETKAAKADFLGVSRASYSKVTRGLEQPSPGFIAAVLHKLGDANEPDSLNRFFRAEVR
ncbi:hypothetical protein [Micromonospora sp. L32]|uniref:hypothetical protein n=1 Tax=Micromonospora sp. L32 TaxID=3452214 RepID=UPI003F8BC92E